MKVCLAQINPTVGDLRGNALKLTEVVAENSQADLIVFSELSLTGYPPKDLLLRPGFLNELEQRFAHLLGFSQSYPRPAIVLGLPWREQGRLFNSAVVLRNGEILGVQHKQNLTRFRAFDETRYFSPGAGLRPILFKKEVLGLALGLELDDKLAQSLRANGVTLLLNPAAFPFRFGAGEDYRREFQSKIAALGIPGFLVNQVGGFDELIFAGASMALNGEGRLADSLPHFCSGSLLVDWECVGGAELEKQDAAAQIHDALVLGLSDYVRKSGMNQVILGLSGGLDSAVAAVLAVRAVGPGRVWGITMPGPYSSAGSVRDSRVLAQNLGIKFDIIPISPLYNLFLETLATQFAQRETDVAEENIQARLRGSLLMALSNKFGGLVLTNSNKSELAVGYCTLYGDMSGGLAVLGDLYKTLVYELAFYINRRQEIIPRATLEKPPSAELRPNQRDDDSLPPYEVLDGILAAYLDRGLSKEAIKAEGFQSQTVDWVVAQIDKSEYKRRQAAPILRVTSPVLGFDRHMPLAGKFDGGWLTDVLRRKN